MIRSFRDRKTQRFFEGQRVRDFQGFADQAARRLAVLNSAESLQNLAALRSNRLESLSGDRAGQYSIRINHSGVFVSDGKKTAPMAWRSWTITDED